MTAVLRSPSLWHEKNLETIASLLRTISDQGSTHSANREANISIRNKFLILFFPLMSIRFSLFTDSSVMPVGPEPRFEPWEPIPI